MGFWKLGAGPMRIFLLSIRLFRKIQINCLAHFWVLLSFVKEVRYSCNTFPILRILVYVCVIPWFCQQIRNINLSFSHFHFSTVMRNDVCMQFTQMVVNSIPNLRPMVRLFEHEFATKWNALPATVGSKWKLVLEVFFWSTSSQVERHKLSLISNLHPRSRSSIWSKEPIQGKQLGWILLDKNE